ncbi:MAG: ABC transporter permease [Chloroflexi bacterium]|nr:ABC transporter permease [Chloroflexota bacterium]
MQATTAFKGAAPLPTVRRQRRAATLIFLLRQRLAVPATAVLLVVVFCAMFANVIAPYDPERQDYAHVMEGPSRAHLLGTDDIGRDVLSRIIYGSRTSVSVGLVAVAISIAFGVGLGLVAAYLRGWVDDIIMRIMDALAAFPALVLALGITAALKPGLLNVMVAIGIIFMPQFARLARGEALSVRELEYVTAARVIGAGAARTIFWHIWPNITAPIIVQASLRVAAAIVTEASLSFLGAGVPPPTASWGGMLRSSYQFTETAPWLALFPGAAIFLTVLATNLFGDALRAALDPRMRGRV